MIFYIFNFPINSSLSNTSISIYISSLILLLNLGLIGSIWPELCSSEHLHIHMVYTLSNHTLMALYSIIILHTILQYYQYYFSNCKKLPCSLDEQVNKVEKSFALVFAVCDELCFSRPLCLYIIVQSIPR